MSGPKKADVEAQLNVARNSQRNCAAMISKAEDAVIARLVREAEKTIRDANADAVKVTKEMNSVSKEMKKAVPESIGFATEVGAQASKELEASRGFLVSAHDAVGNAARIEESARRTFERAESEYERALSGVRNSDGHYLHKEMTWATQATELYNQAAGELSCAASERREAEKSVGAALQQANEARSSMLNALRDIQSTKKEAEARLRAEKEARKIAEQKKRDATLAMEKCRSAVNRLEDIPHKKFKPGAADRIQRVLDAALRLLSSGSLGEAKAKAESALSEANRLEHEVATAQKEFERRKASAEIKICALDANVASMDEGLIASWANSPDALRKAKQALASARAAFKSERFEEAGNGAQLVKEELSVAFESAAQNKSSHDKREKIGEAVMSALNELGFDVSYEAGTRQEPLKIAGQTPDEAGKGDFDIAIPLDGNVDLKVTLPQGDTACVVALQSLKKRLEDKGVIWNTTDWGHAEGAVPQEVTAVNTTKVKTGIKSKGKA